MKKIRKHPATFRWQIIRALIFVFCAAIFIGPVAYDVLNGYNRISSLWVAIASIVGTIFLVFAFFTTWRISPQTIKTEESSESDGGENRMRAVK